jgi:hypothetical protein
MGTDMLSLPRGRLGASWALWSLVGECCVMLIPYFDVAVEVVGAGGFGADGSSDYDM